MMSQPVFQQAVCIFVLLLTAAGCSRNGAIPVRGIVTLDGRPLSGASVLFIAQDPGGRDARGSTNAEGVFHLSTFDSNDGALAGNYKVVVQPAAPLYVGALATSPLEAQQSGGETARPEHVVTVPARFSQPDQTPLTQRIPAAGDVVFDLPSK